MEEEYINYLVNKLNESIRYSEYVANQMYDIPYRKYTIENNVSSENDEDKEPDFNNLVW